MQGRDYPYVVKSKPSIVSTVLERGSHSYIGLLQDDPSSVLKWPATAHRETTLSFETEKQAYQLLGQHRYIVTCRWASEAGICLEYCPTGSIRNYYKSHELPDIAQRLLWCHQTVTAVAYIHSKGLVHCDISTRNILLTPNMDVKLCDFGSTVPEGKSMHGSAEAHYGGARLPNDAKASLTYDLFCMGALFYEVIGGKQPFEELG